MARKQLGAPQRMLPVDDHAQSDEVILPEQKSSTTSEQRARLGLRPAGYSPIRCHTKQLP